MKTYSVGQTVIHTGRIGPMPGEFRGYADYDPDTGQRRACVIFRPAGSCPYQCLVNVSELSEPPSGEVIEPNLNP
jgi:hypothetical protein